MTMTSLEPISLDEILPSGDTLDLVSPGMSSVVGRLEVARQRSNERYPSKELT